MRFNINMDNKEQFERDLIVPEPGDYDLTIRNVPKLEKSKSSNNQICKLELEGETEGGKFVVFDNLVATDESQWKWYQCWRACGFSDEEITEGIELEDMRGLTLRARLSQEVYEGKPQARLKQYLYERDAQ